MKELVIGQLNTITFQVNVMGTSIEPKVRVLLSTSPELSYPASKSIGGWSVAVVLPEGTQTGIFNLRVEVMLNNRLFTPLTTPVHLIQSGVVPAMEVPAMEVPAMEVPAMEVPAMEVPAMEVAEKQDIVIQTVEERAVEEVKLEPLADNKLSSVAIAELFKTENVRVEVKPVKMKYAPIIPREEINIPINTSLPVTEKIKVTHKKKLIEVKHELPIRLVKGDVVYE